MNPRRAHGASPFVHFLGAAEPVAAAVAVADPVGAALAEPVGAALADALGAASAVAVPLGAASAVAAAVGAALADAVGAGLAATPCRQATFGGAGNVSLCELGSPFLIWRSSVL